MLSNQRVALIGLGKLGESLVRALLDSGVVRPEQVTATAKHAETLERKSGIGVRTTLDNEAAVAGADLIILCVKPQAMAGVLEAIRPAATPDNLVLSTAAGVGTAAIERGLGGPVPVVRAMPNTPCLVRSGMTAVSAGAHAGDEHVALAREVFDAVGRSLVVDEAHMDAVTGLSGSGPAFMYVVLEALAEGGLAVGLPRTVATELIAQTMSARTIHEDPGYEHRVPAAVGGG